MVHVVASQKASAKPAAAPTARRQSVLQSSSPPRHEIPTCGPLFSHKRAEFMRPSIRRAFTLVELLTVLAIIVILAAIMFPVLAAAREKARQSACLSNLKQISLAQSLYIADWDERLPHWWMYAPEKPGGFTFWTEYFQPYLHDEGVLRCPSFTWGPDGPDVGDLLAHYALLTWGPGGTGTAGDPYWHWAGPPMALGSVSRPSETFNLVDGYTTTQVTRGLFLRHHSGFNVGFLDGRAKWMAREQAFSVEKGPSGEWRYRYISADRG